MWDAHGEPFDAGRFTSFEPAEVPYPVDGPRLFTLQDADGGLNLACWSDADGTANRYLVVPTTAASVDRLGAGIMSVHAALDQSQSWVCDVTCGGDVVGCVRMAFADVPADTRPATDVLMLPTLR